MIVSSPYDKLLQSLPVRELTASVPGIERRASDTRYWEYGDPAATTTLVLVHGFRGDHHGLQLVVAEMLGDATSSPDLRIVAPDLPGFGQSAPFRDGTHSLSAYVGWLQDFLRVLAPTGRVVVLGHSFGSIVVAAAVADKLAVDEVILVNPIAAPALSGPRGILTRLAVFYYWAAATLPERWGYALLQNRAIVRVMSVSMAKTHDAQLRRWIHNQHDRYFSAFANRQVVMAAFTASVSHDVSEFAAQIRQPTLLIAADKDDITPLAAQYRLKTLFPNATLRVIENVGHLIHYEKPKPAAACIRDFLAAERPL
ncbi:alpha/beta hydrolase [Cryobacterium sp. TMT1-3]|uniref:Alpha/beta hydrolase n=1 Tax=Cryobacterium luteum TaxID=1424661 RepID=A0A1H8D748_9MICO|nr:MULTISPECIES: alpha/beta hydrolase [Cryobacterium]TFB91901.1 alpha/beta hydrolase [Cryobacterium luteum]TFC31125.1 alpha/beta hydrolase [Cryobacterium sp. TMT1-3]SEN02438.1 Pimeloyl-ACP methyl ester carboxylesterase [Cryobacterium luteum]